jgi:hypothetical protein
MLASVPLQHNRFSALTFYPIHIHKCLSLTCAINFFYFPLFCFHLEILLLLRVSRADVTWPEIRLCYM